MRYQIKRVAAEIITRSYILVIVFLGVVLAIGIIATAVDGRLVDIDKSPETTFGFLAIAGVVALTAAIQPEFYHDNSFP